jgi:hypothetical protein
LLVGNCLVDANIVFVLRVCGLVRGWDKPSAY